MQLEHQGYFGLQGIRNLYQDLPKYLQVSDLQKLSNGDAQKIVSLHDRICVDTIVKKIDISLKKIRIH